MIKLDSIFVLILCSLLISGCSKKDPEIVIKAGEFGGNSIYYFYLDSVSLFYRSGYYLDVKKDNENDFFFSEDEAVLGAGHFISYTINLINSGESVYVLVDNKNYPLVLKSGDKIYESLKWVNSKNLVLYSEGESSYPPTPYSYSYGNWNGVHDGYLGFKIVKGSRTYMGWMCLSLWPAYFIKDYAYLVIN